MKEFIKNGHKPYIVTPREKKMNEETEFIETEKYGILKVKIGNISDVSLVEKGISTVTLSDKFYNSIIKYLGSKKIDLILYSTPPITLSDTVIKLKRKYSCKTYLMLKDIFPQNAVDLGMFSNKGILYWYFRRKERILYRISDRIGCMSKANVTYLTGHNPDINPNIVEICPNSIEVYNKSISVSDKKNIRRKYKIPVDKKIFIYGGNLGKPQGIPFLVECLKSQEKNANLYFLIVGNGSEYDLLEKYIKENRPINVRLLRTLPKEKYDVLVASCDVGMIFLDHRFTIPNFPSRLLTYMEAKIPVLAVTDPYTDLGKIIVDGGFGWWCESNDTSKFDEIIHTILSDNICDFGERGYRFLTKNYSVEKSFDTIVQIMKYSKV